MGNYTMKVSFDTGATAAQLNAAVAQLRAMGIEAVSVNSKLTATSTGFRNLGENTISFKTQVGAAATRTSEFGEVLKKLNATAINSTTALNATEAATRRLALAEIAAYQQEAKINAAKISDSIKLAAAQEKQRMATLSAIASSQAFQQRMLETSHATSEAAAKTGWLGDKLSAVLPTFGDFGNVLQRVGLRLAAYATYAAAASVAGAPIVALKEYADFEEKMRNVQAASGATDVELISLGKSARQTAVELKRFNAAEVAEGLYSLASAGYTATEQLKAIRPVMLFAAAAQADLALSSELIVSTLKIFGKGAEEAGSVADTMAASIAKTALTAERLSYAMRNAGPSAAAYGQTVTGTVAALGALVDKFNSGEKAGTGLATLFKQMEIHQKELGVAVLDSAGHMRPLVDIIQSLEEKGVSAQKVLEILGRGAGPALAALLRTGSESLRKLEADITSSGQAGQISGKQLEAFKNQVREISANVGDMMIELGEALASGMTNKQGGIVSIVQEMSHWIKENKKDVAEFGAAFVSVATFLVRAGADVLGAFVDIAIVVKDIFSNKIPAMIAIIGGGLAATTIAYGATSATVWLGVITSLELATAATAKFTAMVAAADAALAANPVGIIAAGLVALGLAVNKNIENYREFNEQLIENEIRLAAAEKATQGLHRSSLQEIDDSIEKEKAYLKEALASAQVLEVQLAKLSYSNFYGGAEGSEEYNKQRAALDRLYKSIADGMSTLKEDANIRRMLLAMASDQAQNDEDAARRADEKKEKDRLALENLKATQREFKALLNALLPVQKAEKDLAEWQAKASVLIGQDGITQEQYALVIESLRQKISDLTDEEERRAKVLALGQNGEQKKALKEEIDNLEFLTSAYKESVTAGNQARIMLEREAAVRQAVGKEIKENANQLAQLEGQKFDAARAADAAQFLATVNLEIESLENVAQAYQYSTAAGIKAKENHDILTKATKLSADANISLAEAKEKVIRQMQAEKVISGAGDLQGLREQVTILEKMAGIRRSDFGSMSDYQDALAKMNRELSQELEYERIRQVYGEAYANQWKELIQLVNKYNDELAKTAKAERLRKAWWDAANDIGNKLSSMFEKSNEGLAKLIKGAQEFANAFNSVRNAEGGGQAIQGGAAAGAGAYNTGLFGDAGGGQGKFGGKLSGNYADVGATIGGAIGAAIGAYIGSGVFSAQGAAIGAVIGTVIGGIVGSLIKSGADEGLASLRMYGNELHTQMTKDEGGLGGMVTGIGNNIIDGLKRIVSAIGATLNATAGLDLKIRDDQIIVFVNGIRRVFRETADAVNFAIGELLRTADVSGLSDNSRAVINNARNQQTGSVSADTLASNLEFARSMDRIDFGATGQALAELSDWFRITRDRALDLGLTQETLVAIINKLNDGYEAARITLVRELQILSGTYSEAGNVASEYNTRVNNALRAARELNNAVATEQRQREERVIWLRSEIAAQTAAAAAARAAFVAARNETGFGGPRDANNSLTDEEQARLNNLQTAADQADASVAALTAELNAVALQANQAGVSIEAYISGIIANSAHLFDEFTRRFTDGPIDIFNRQMDQFADYRQAAQDVYQHNLEIATTDRQRAQAANALGESLAQLDAAQAAYQQTLADSTFLGILETIARHTDDPAIALRISQIKWKLEIANLYVQLALLEAIRKKAVTVGASIDTPVVRDENFVIGGKSGTLKPPVQEDGQSDTSWLRDLLAWLETLSPGDVAGGTKGGGGRKEARKTLQEELADAMRPVEGQWATEVRNWAEQGQKWIEEAKKAGVSLADVAKATEAMRLKLAASAKEDIAEKLKPSSAAGKAMMDLIKWKKDMEDAAKALGLSLEDINAAYQAAFARIVAQVHLDVQEYANVGGRDDLRIALLKNKQQADDLRASLEDLAKKGVDVSADLKAVALAEAQRAKMLKQQARIDFFTDLAGMLKDGADKTWLLANATRMKYIMEIGMLKAQFAILDEMGIFTEDTARRIQGILDNLPPVPENEGPVDTRQQQAELFGNIANLLDDGIDKTWLLENAQQIKYDLEVANLKLQLQILEAAHAFAPEVLARLHHIIDNLPDDIPVPDVEKGAREKFKSIGTEIADLGDKSGGLAGRFRDLKQKNEDLAKKIHESGLGIGRQAELMRQLKEATDEANKALIAQSTADLMEGLAQYVDNEIDRTWLLQQAAQIKYDMEIAQMLVQLSILEAQADITDQQRKDYERIRGLILSLPDDAPNVNGGGGGGGGGSNGFDDAQALIDSLRGMITQAIPGVAGQFAALDAEFQSIREQAAALNLDLYLGPGGGAALIDEAYAARVQALWNQILQPLSDFVDSLDLSDLSPLTPQQRLDLARARYEETAAAALAGDADAAAALAQVSQQYLQEAQGLGTATQAYGAIFAQVQQIANQILAMYHVGQPATGSGSGTPALPVIDGPGYVPGLSGGISVLPTNSIPTGIFGQIFGGTQVSNARDGREAERIVRTLETGFNLLHDDLRDIKSELEDMRRANASNLGRRTQPILTGVIRRGRG